MEMLRAIIVDDERIGRTRLRRLLEKEGDIELVAECADGSTAIEAVREARPDLLFLDIQIPGKDGFDVLDQVGPDAQPGAVIFVTAFDEHAVRAFEACALDYLLKPVSQERLSKALGRARQHLATHPRGQSPTGACQSWLSQSSPVCRPQLRSRLLRGTGGNRLGRSSRELHDPARRSS